MRKQMLCFHTNASGISIVNLLLQYFVDATINIKFAPIAYEIVLTENCIDRTIQNQ